MATSTSEPTELPEGIVSTHTNRTGFYTNELDSHNGVVWTTQKVSHDELKRLILQGLRVKDCAKILRLAPETLRKYIRSEVFQRELNALSADQYARIDEEILYTKMSHAQTIEAASTKALCKIVELIDSSDERVAQKAAADILDRNANTSKHHRIDSTSTQLQLTPEILKLAAEASLQIEGHFTKVVETAPKEAPEGANNPG